MFYVLAGNNGHRDLTTFSFIEPDPGIRVVADYTMMVGSQVVPRLRWICRLSSFETTANIIAFFVFYNVMMKAK